MRTLYVFGLVVLWQNQFVIYTCAKNSDLVERKCKYTENTIQRLKTCLFRNYDNTVHPNYLKGITNVTLKLMPKVMEFSRNTVLSLHSWILLTWEDPQLTWTPKNYDGITFIHVKSWEIWMPDVSVFNSGDMSSDLFELSQMDCLLFNEGSISCVPAVKFMSKCDTDFIYWPYDKHQCHVTFGSWSHKGEEVDLHIDGEGISMSSFWNTEWDFKFISSAKQVYKYDCCPNETYPKINYNFLLTRYYDKHHIAFSIPVIVLILITVTVFWLDTRSVERLMLASVNLICHLLCMFYLHWQLPYNGTYTPNIMLFYRESLALAIFAVILTAILRKLEDMSTEIPIWVLSLITLILNNKTGRFLILKNEESKITNEDTTTKEHSNIAKSLKIKESWKHFTVIIDWLSFFCVVFIYIIILIILVPVT